MTTDSDSAPGLAEETLETWELEFLRHYEATLGNIALAAQRSGIDRSRVYRRKRNSPTFAQAFSAAQMALLDSLESEVLRRARDGFDEPVFRNGVEVGKRRKYSDSLAQFLLKARKPEQYGGNAAGAGESTEMNPQEVLASWRAHLGVNKTESDSGPTAT